MSQRDLFIEEETSEGLRRVAAVPYKAVRDGVYEYFEPAQWENGPAGSPARCLTPLTGKPGTEGRKGNVRIVRNRVEFKAGETKLLPATEVVHQFECEHPDCADHKRYCRGGDAHNRYRTTVGGATWLVRSDLPDDQRPEVHAAAVAVLPGEKEHPLQPVRPGTTRAAGPSTAEDLFAARVRAAREARANRGGT